MIRWGALFLLAGLPACDPCSGIGVCGGPQVRYEGELILRFRNEPAEGIRVEFVRTGGVGLEPGSFSVRSDARGKFVLEGRAAGEGQVIGDLVIHPPTPVPPIRVEGVRLATSRAEGEVRNLGSWRIAHPYLPYFGELYYRATNERASGLRVEFRRTGGVPIEPETFRATTDFAGRFPLSPKALAHGEVVGDLTIVPLPPAHPYTIPDVKLATAIEERPPSLAFYSGVGAYLPWSGLFVYDDTRRSAEGVEVEFRRTGGVPVKPDRYVTRTNASGTFSLDPVPLTTGEVEAELIVRPPAPYRTDTIRGLRLPTVQLDRDYRLAGVWLIHRR